MLLTSLTPPPGIVADGSDLQRGGVRGGVEGRVVGRGGGVDGVEVVGDGRDGRRRRQGGVDRVSIPQRGFHSIFAHNALARYGPGPFRR